MNVINDNAFWQFWSPTFPAFLVAWTVPFWILTSASVNALLPLLGCESCILSHLNCHKDMSLLSMATHLPCISYQRDSSLQCPKYNHTCLDIFLFLQFCFLVSSNKKSYLIPVQEPVFKDTFDSPTFPTLPVARTPAFRVLTFTPVNTLFTILCFET